MDEARIIASIERHTDKGNIVSLNLGRYAKHLCGVSSKRFREPATSINKAEFLEGIVRLDVVRKLQASMRYFDLGHWKRQDVICCYMQLAVRMVRGQELCLKIAENEEDAKSQCGEFRLVEKLVKIFRVIRNDELDEHIAECLHAYERGDNRKDKDAYAKFQKSSLLLLDLVVPQVERSWSDIIFDREPVLLKTDQLFIAPE